MVTALLILAYGLLSAAYGYWMGKRHSIDYKQRWLNANHALQKAIESGEVEQKVVTKEVVKEVNKAPTPMVKRLHKMTSYDRYVMEGDLLRAGQRPVDDLEGFDDYYYTRAIKRRLKYGYGVPK
jgi:hypothetical protein